MRIEIKAKARSISNQLGPNVFGGHRHGVSRRVFVLSVGDNYFRKRFNQACRQYIKQSRLI